jgi:hypothetical protein
MLALAMGVAGYASPAAALDKYVVSLGTAATVCDFDEQCNAGFCTSDGTTACIDDSQCPRCVNAENEDLLLCDPVVLGPGNTQCRWSLFFDGSAAGLNSNILGVDLLPNGDLILRVGADGSIPDISGVKAKDLARFVPKDGMGDPTPFQLPYTNGEWSLFLDGDAVKGASDARRWDAVEVLFPKSCTDLNGNMTIEPQECDVLLSLPGGADLEGIAFKDEDILRCRPILSPGGTISDCEYALFLDSSQINETPFPGADPGGETDSFNTDLFALELMSFDKDSLSGTVLFRAGSEGTLPSHEPPRDLLEMAVSFGPTGACSTTTSVRCLADGDCPATETCGSFDTNPATSTPTVVAFDGDLPGARVVPDFAAGLQGETIHALTIVPDADDDGIPDGIDNCPDVANPPEICSGGVVSCTTDDDCPGAETCEQLDTDDDGIGDVCDQCYGRPDSECECGDQITDPPNETCDLGDDPVTGNGQPGVPCSADCQIVGHCTQTDGPCVVDDDCPNFPAEGCCGNNMEEGDEECDDGNGINDDECDNECQDVAAPVPVLGCEDLVGPNIVPAFSRPSKFLDTAQVVDPGFDKWKVKGEFQVSSGVLFDPDSQDSTIIFSQDAIIYEATVPAGTFVQSGSPVRPKWKFGLAGQDPDIPGGEGWRRGKFNVKGNANVLLNRVGYNLKGQGVAIDIDPGFLPPAPPNTHRVRQTIRVNDFCATVVLTCAPKGSGLKCTSQQLPP